MLRDCRGKPLTRERIYAARARAGNPPPVSAVFAGATCQQAPSDAGAFLLGDDRHERCCFCGLPREDHHGGEAA